MTNDEFLKRLEKSIDTLSTKYQLCIENDDFVKSMDVLRNLEFVNRLFEEKTRQKEIDKSIVDTEMAISDTISTFQEDTKKMIDSTFKNLNNIQRKKMKIR